MSLPSKTRRYFTEAARQAAAEARLRKREHRARFPDDDKLVMVVVRAAEPATGFCWQIRRFGHVAPVAESRDRFSCPVEAGRSGQSALSDMKAEAMPA